MFLYNSSSFTVGFLVIKTILKQKFTNFFMINSNEQKFLNNLINKYEKISSNNKPSYSLLENAFSNTDIISGIKVLLSKRITMSSITQKFENEFAKFIGSKHALMVNSGSSANLISVFALINPKKKID